MNTTMDIETFTKFLNFSRFLINLLTFSAEELALLYTESTLHSFAAACHRRDDRAYKALVSTFPGGEAELLATLEADYNAYEHTLANECAKWGNLAAHITDAIMVVRRRNVVECAAMMAA